MPEEQEQFFIHKSKLQIKGEKIDRKQKLRKINPPKIIIDSDIEDGQHEQKRAKRKAKKWWQKVKKKYFQMMNLNQSLQELDSIQDMPITADRLGNSFQQIIVGSSNNSAFLSEQPSLRIIFRLQTTLDQKQFHLLLFYKLNQISQLISNLSKVNQSNSQMLNQQQQSESQHLIEQIPQFFSQENQNALNPNTHIWCFRNLHKKNKSIENITEQQLRKLSHDLIPFDSEQNQDQILKFLRYQALSHQSSNSIECQTKLWEQEYDKIFTQNEVRLNRLTEKISQGLAQQEKQQELKEMESLIIQATKAQLLWGQVLLYFKKGHSDKTQQLLNDAMEIMMIKEMNMQQNLKKKKSTKIQKLKCLFETDCKICFCTQSDQKIKVFYCDGCNTSFHQTCYGIKEDKIKLNQQFFCDVCLYQRGLLISSQIEKTQNQDDLTMLNKSSNISKNDKKIQIPQKFGKRQSQISLSNNKANKPSCQICLKKNFPMRNLNGHFYHVTCLFMFNLVQLKNSELFLKEEYDHQRILQELIINQTVSQQCQFCLKNCGMKFKCPYSSCNKWFHPICAYLNGAFFQIDRKFKQMSVKVFCESHSRLEGRDSLNQTYIRRFFCDYKKTSNLMEEDFQELYKKQLQEINAQRIEKFKSNTNMLLKKYKTSIFGSKSFKKSDNYFGRQSQRILSLAESSQPDFQFQKAEYYSRQKKIQEDLGYFSPNKS